MPILFIQVSVQINDLEIILNASLQFDFFQIFYFDSFQRRAMNFTGRHQNPGMSLQIHHEIWEKQPKNLYKGINGKFIEKIEHNHDPSNQYRNKMKGLYMEELEKSLKEYEHRASFEEKEHQHVKKEYREKINGILAELEKNKNCRDIFYANRINRQDQYCKRFVDEDKLKENRYRELVEKNLDNNLFNHQSDSYQNYQTEQFRQTLFLQAMQQQYKNEQRNMDKAEKEKQVQQRIQYEDGLRKLQQYEQLSKKESQEQYKLDLLHLVQEKNRPKVEAPCPKTLKHNPITNPIEYHIDNPYILKQMQRKYHHQSQKSL